MNAETIWQGFMVFVIVFCLVMLYTLIRSQWVHKRRMEMLDSEVNTFQKLKEFDAMPSYEAMIARFWVWDFEKLKVKK